MSARLERIGRGSARAGLVATLLAHGLAIGVVVYTARGVEPLGTVYAVKLVAAPPPSESRRAAAEAAPRPAERSAPVDPPKPAPPPPPPPPRAPPKPRTEAPPKTANPATPLPGETPSTGSDVANVNTPGVAFPFPEYLRNLVNEIYKRWQRPGGPQSLQTQVTFLISRDGTVREIELASRSRSISFDLSARGAVEKAAIDRAFGPLPEGFPSDVLMISLWFKPQGTP